jgi:hypothetical protein
MADLFVTLVSVVPKPSTLTVGGPQSDQGNRSNNGTFTSIQSQQVTTPGTPPGK